MVGWIFFPILAASKKTQYELLKFNIMNQLLLLKPDAPIVFFRRIYRHSRRFASKEPLAYSQKFKEVIHFCSVLQTYLRISYFHFSSRDVPSDIKAHLAPVVVLMEVFTRGAGFDFVSSYMSSLDLLFLTKNMEKYYNLSFFENRESYCFFLNSLYEFS
ncbi:hypothetical protein [Sigmofec virus UA08Rod_6404]|uniref:Uncharacterized protein n=1 Tax=Sigmofec virus UA08Rod_6404 TaxID=2929229 RepID=A0A976N106_9VIRU|nr:hypothetical protein [Sigmofec virus UA08Rod_6404]